MAVRKTAIFALGSNHNYAWMPNSSLSRRLRAAGKSGQVPRGALIAAPRGISLSRLLPAEPFLRSLAGHAEGLCNLCPAYLSMAERVDDLREMLAVRLCCGVEGSKGRDEAISRPRRRIKIPRQCSSAGHEKSARFDASVANVNAARPCGQLSDLAFRFPQNERHSLRHTTNPTVRTTLTVRENLTGQCSPFQYGWNSLRIFRRLPYPPTLPGRLLRWGIRRAAIVSCRDTRAAAAR